MTLRINTNIGGLFATKQFQKTDKNLSTSLDKISSGFQINKASDNASGMTIADKLGSQARGISQAIQNTNDAVAITQIADGALEESANLINIIRTKALQAANDSQSPESRAAIQADIDKAMSSLNDIAQNTSFNGEKLLNGDFTEKTFQTGPNQGETISMSIESVETETLGNENGKLSDINVLTKEGAEEAIDIADAALQQLDNVRAGIGSKQNQMHSTIANLSVSRINNLAAESTLKDTDFAEESNIFSIMDIKNKAQLFAISQANSSGKTILNLLQS